MAKKPAVLSKDTDARRIQTRRSGVHGKGVFAVQDIAEGETLIEYVGEHISWMKPKPAIRTTPKTPTTRFTSR